jgi:hypothetical protein
MTMAFAGQARAHNAETGDAFQPARAIARSVRHISGNEEPLSLLHQCATLSSRTALCSTGLSHRRTRVRR